MTENPYVCCTVTDNYLVEYNRYEYLHNDNKHFYVDFIYDDIDKPKLSLCIETGHCIEGRDIFDDDKFDKQYTLTRDQMRSFLFNHKKFVCDMIDNLDELLNWITEDEYQNIYDEQVKEQAQCVK